VREEPAVLLHVAHFSAKENWRLGADILLSHSHFSTLRLDQAIETAQKRRFSRPAFSDQSYCLPLWNLDTHIVERHHGSKPVRNIPRS
jgi:hypothetical protein